MISIPPTATSREILDALDAWFCAKDITRNDETNRSLLWDILTALRGPDSESVSVKAQTTAIIRALVFPRLETSLSIQNRLCAEFQRGTVADVAQFLGTLRDEPKDISSHFCVHIRFAIQALERITTP